MIYGKYNEKSFDFTKQQQYILPIKSFIHQNLNIINLWKNIEQAIYILKKNKQLEQENKDLRYKLYKFNYSSDKIISKFFKSDQENIELVIGFDKGMFDSFLIISRTDYGKNSAQEGDIVFSNDGLIGIVATITNNYSLVRTITNSRIFIPSKTKDGALLVLHGTDSNFLESVAIKNTNSKLAIKVGDILYTSGEGGLFKQNIPVAKVISVSEEKLIAEPIVYFPKLEFVNFCKPINIKEFAQAN